MEKMKIEGQLNISNYKSSRYSGWIHCSKQFAFVCLDRLSNGSSVSDAYLNLYRTLNPQNCKRIPAGTQPSCFPRFRSTVGCVGHPLKQIIYSHPTAQSYLKLHLTIARCLAVAYFDSRFKKFFEWVLCYIITDNWVHWRSPHVDHYDYLVAAVVAICQCVTMPKKQRTWF